MNAINNYLWDIKPLENLALETWEVEKDSRERSPLAVLIQKKYFYPLDPIPPYEYPPNI